MRLILENKRNIQIARISKGQRIQNPNTQTNKTSPKSLTNSKKSRNIIRTATEKKNQSLLILYPSDYDVRKICLGGKVITSEYEIFKEIRGSGLVLSNILNMRGGPYLR